MDTKPRSIAKMEGTVLVGPRGELTFERSMVKTYGLEGCKKMSCARFAIFARAYHGHFEGGLWPDPAGAIEVFGEGAVIVVASDAYEHIALPIGDAPPLLPSASPTMQSLAAALASGDASRFVPGRPNTRRY